MARPIPQSCRRQQEMVDGPLPHFIGGRLCLGLRCPDFFMEGGNPTSFGVPSSVNGGLQSIGDEEWYLCLKRDIHRDLQEQVEYIQCETQAVIEGDALILCEGANSSPYLVPHVTKGSLCFLKEGGQLPVILELVVVHHFVHLLPCGISLGAEAVSHGLMFCFCDVIP